MSTLTLDTMVDLRSFPLPIVQNALYVLSDRIDSRLRVQEDSQIHLTLCALDDGLTTAEMERELHAALLAASVNEQAFHKAAPIRNYLAQTAFSITTENQQTIEEFVISLGNGRTDEHAGAPTNTDPLATDEQADLTGNQLMLDKENGRVFLQLDRREYLLPDVLWAAYQARDICACSIIHGTQGQLVARLEPKDEKANLHTLGERFEHWLEIALEQPR